MDVGYTNSIEDHMNIGYLSIRKYDSTFYVGIGHVKNSCLYLRYGSSSEKTTAYEVKTSHTTNIHQVLIRAIQTPDYWSFLGLQQYNNTFPWNAIIGVLL